MVAVPGAGGEHSDGLGRRARQLVAIEPAAPFVAIQDEAWGVNGIAVPVVGVIALALTGRRYGLGWLGISLNLWGNPLSILT